MSLVQVCDKFHCFRCHTEQTTRDDGYYKHMEKCKHRYDVVYCGRINGKECEIDPDYVPTQENETGD